MGVQKKLNVLSVCRTEALGGHVEQCRDCGHKVYHYHSCGDRHCPQCGGAKRAAWLEARRAELLPAPYFHVVFTAPHELSALMLGNRRELYQLLFDASAQTLLEVAADPKRLGARIGVLAVLHTWGQQLEHHPHIHCVVPGGGLTPEGTGWKSCRPKFFLPVKVLGRVFRGKFLAGLRKAYAQGKLQFGGSTAALAASEAFHRWLQTLYAHDWVVYAKEPFGGPEQVLKYLTQYTHRVAISNRRLVKVEDEQVTFTYKDYAAGCARKELTLSAVEFIRRFSLHIFPWRFTRIRQYGLLSNRGRRKRLALCRELLEKQRAGAPSSGRWLVPCLVVAMLATPAPAGDATAGSPSRQVSEPPLSETAVVGGVCPRCGVGKLETIWERPRPTGEELEVIRRGKPP